MPKKSNETNFTISSKTSKKSTFISNKAFVTSKTKQSKFISCNIQHYHQPISFLKTFRCNKKTTSRRIPTPYAKRMMGFDITLDNTNSSISGHDNIKNTYCSFLIHFQTLCLKYNDIQDNNTNFTSYISSYGKRRDLNTWIFRHLRYIPIPCYCVLRARNTNIKHTASGGIGGGLAFSATVETARTFSYSSKSTFPMHDWEIHDYNFWPHSY